MRNLKKFLAVLVVVAMIATSMMTAFGAADASMTPADKAVGLGLLQGGSNGVDEEYLNTNTQRIQTAIIYLRLLGLEDKAKAYTATTDNFADADKVKDVPGATNLLAYLKANPQLGWVGDGTNFNPLGDVSGKALYKVMLTSLGYTQGLDFDYDDTVGFARAKGFALAAYVGTSEAVSNNAMAAAMMEAVDLPVNGKTTTLAQQLVDTKVLTAENAAKYTGYTVAPVGPFAIASVKSTNLKSVVVTFNQPVDATKGADKTNYTAKVGTTDKGVANVKLAADKMSAEILMTTAIAQLDKVTVTYAKAAISATTTADATATSDAISDTTMPTVKSITVTGNKLLTITYSEPVNADNAKYLGNYTIDGTVYSSNAPTLSDDGYIVTLNLTQRMAAGAHKVVVKSPDVKDYAGIPVSPNSTDITVATDTTAPAKVTLKGDATQTKVVVNFDKAVDTIGSVKAGSIVGTATADAVDKTLWTITFPFDASLPASTSTLTFTNVTDLYNNTAASLTLTVTPVLDNVRPAYVSFTQIDKDNFYVTFSKEVQLPTASNFTLKKADGGIVGLASAPAYYQEGTPLADNKTKVKLNVTAVDTAANGPYTLAITGVKDNTALQNVIVDYTVTGMTFADKTAPTLAVIANPIQYSAISGTTPAKIYVAFSEKVDSATATAAANYTLIINNIAGPLPDNSSLAIASDGSTVVITLPITYTTVASIGRVNVAGVKDLALNAITADSRVPAPASATPPSLGAAYITAKNTIVVTVAGATLNAGSVLGYDFGLSNGNDTLTVSNAKYETGTGSVYDTNGLGIITLTTAQDMNADGSYGNNPSRLKLYTAATITAASPFGVPMTVVNGFANGAYINDKCQATATAVSAAYTETGVDTKIVVSINEPLAPQTIASPGGLPLGFKVVIDGVARAFNVDTTGTNTLVFTVAASTFTNKAYTVTFDPFDGTTITDVAGAGGALGNANALKSFSFSGTIAPNP